MIKNILKKLQPSSTLMINEYSKSLEKKGQKIFKFGFGQSPFNVPKDIVNELKKNAHQNKYLPIQGLQTLRNAISKYYSKKYKQNYSPESIIIGPGSKELMFLLHLLFDGTIILPAPSWVSYAPQAKIGRNNIKWIETKPENNWFPTAFEIEKIIKKGRKKNYLLFLNSPNNPSGQICQNLKEIAQLTKKYNFLILSDEIYSELTFSDNFDSISKYSPKNTIISSGISKWCGAGGWRLGFLIIPKNLKKITEKLKVLASESFSSVSAPIQKAAIIAYKNNHRLFIDNSRFILKFIGEYVYENLKSNNVLINKPQGGFYLMPEFINKKFLNSREMCKSILKETGVALLPGSDFGFSKKRMLARLSFTDFDGAKLMDHYSKNKKLNYDIVNHFAPNIVEGTKRLKQWSK